MERMDTGRPPPLGMQDDEMALDPMALRQRPRVYIHACGRLETVIVERVSVEDICAAARASFDFPLDQDMGLFDKDGHEITSDQTLKRMQGHNETVYARLSDGAFHDFERRIDQIQHMQIGYLCDQMATFRQEHSDLHIELKNLRQAIDQETAARDKGDEAGRRLTDEVRSLAHRQQQLSEERLEALESQLYDVKQVVREEALSREQVNQESTRGMQELRDLLGVEGKARENAADRLRLEIEETRRALQLEVQDREECEVRVERGLRDLREAIGDATEANTSEAAEVRRQLLDFKQAVAVEQRDRLSADADLSTTAKELRAAIQSEVRDRAADCSRVAGLCNEAATDAEAERLARQKSFADLTQQLGVIVESIQEEQTLRSSEDAELSAMVESLRRFVDDARKRLEETELTVAKTVHDLSKGFSREAQAREEEVAKMMRMLQEDVDSRQETESKVGRAVASLKEHAADEADRRARDTHEVVNRVNSMYVSLQAEQKERLAAVDEVSERIQALRRRFAQMMGVPEGEEDNPDHGSILEREREERVAAFRKLDDKLKVEADAREKGDMALSRSVAAAKEAVEAFTEGGGGAGDGAMKEGLTKIVEALGQERTKRTEAMEKLRADCREAIQKEINARLEHDKQVQEELESERHHREEVVEAIQLAIESIQHGLETHTHEFDMEGEESGGATSDTGMSGVESSDVGGSRMGMVR